MLNKFNDNMKKIVVIYIKNLSIKKMSAKLDKLDNNAKKLFIMLKN